MHLFQKCLKYAFAYARMQMHNYPKPSYKYHGCNEFKFIKSYNILTFWSQIETYVVRIRVIVANIGGPVKFIITEFDYI